LITLDTSGLIAALNSRDEHHAAVMAVMRRERGERVVPVAIMSEVAYFVEQRLGHPALVDFIEDIEAGAFVLSCQEQGWGRILALTRRYADLPLGLADAAVIECAERHGGKVLTLDRRHFGVVEREGIVQVLP
jgi:predicted nucleic acid-binding protein